MSREKKIAAFNPDENGLRDKGIFGLPFTIEEAQVILLPVPWEATVSYSEGTAQGPEAILQASYQIDLYDPFMPGGWKAGIAMEEIPPEMIQLNNTCRAGSVQYLDKYTSHEGQEPDMAGALQAINTHTAQLAAYVKDKSQACMHEGKFVGIVGGEHSVPLGYMQALAEKYAFGILQIDAHADLRPAYEGFEHSHASIMYNALKINNVTRLVQVGIRDYSEGENRLVTENPGKIRMFSDRELKAAIYAGKTWADMCDKIIEALPDNVYISFDIDGLQPWLCPHTGTPVPGGLVLEEVFYLIEKLADSHKKIIGFDLCEVAPGPDEWDGNVGSRVLYKLCMAAIKNNGIR